MNSIHIYHLANCDTCQKILKIMAPPADARLQDIKTEKISPEQIDQMAKMAGSYEALFSRRALKYKSMGLAKQVLQEADYRRLILEEYTFLKRPVSIIGKQIFIGNTAEVVKSATRALRP